jgi:hypothetical protein
MIADAPRGRDIADLEEAIRYAENLEGSNSDLIEELLELMIEDRSLAARQRLRSLETEMEEARDNAAELRKRRDTMTSASVMRKLDGIWETLSQSPLNIAEANRALKQALRKMVMRPTEGRLEIHWNHTDEPQEINLYTSRFWEAVERREAKET